MPSQGVTNVANAIINKINNLISSHNSNENAHQDIRESIPSATSELNNNSGFITSSSVPNPSSTTPSADTTNGSVGDGTTWARSNHTHPRSSLYAEANHTHDSIYPAYEIDNLNVDDVHYAAGHLHYESFSNAIYYSDVDGIGDINKELAVKGDVSNLQNSVNSLSGSITNLNTRVKRGSVNNVSVKKKSVVHYTVTHNLGRPNVPVVTLNLGNSNSSAWGDTQVSVYDITNNQFKVIIFNNTDSDGNFGFNWVVVATN